MLPVFMVDDIVEGYFYILYIFYIFLYISKKLRVLLNRHLIYPYKIMAKYNRK